MSGISGSFGYCCMARNSPLTRRQQIVPSPIVLLLPPHFSLPVFLVTCRCDPFRFLYLLKHFRARGRIYARPNARARRRARAHAHRRAHGSQELAEIGVDEAVRAAIRASTAQASRWRCPPRFHGGATLQLAAASRAGVATANMRRLLRGE